MLEHVGWDNCNPSSQAMITYILRTSNFISFNLRAEVFIEMVILRLPYIIYASLHTAKSAFLSQYLHFMMFEFQESSVDFLHGTTYRNLMI